MRRTIRRAVGTVLVILLLTVSGLLTVTGISSANLPTPTVASSVHEMVAAKTASVQPSVSHPASGGTSPAWQKLCTGAAPYNCINGPGTRIGASLAWDAVNNYGVEFGGGNLATTGLQNKTYEWNRGMWSALPNGPATLTARSNASMVYDINDGYVVLFGGYVGSGAVTNTAFKYVGGVWSALSTGPLGRTGASMVYVPSVGGHGGYALLFGGQNGSVYYSDTWKFTGGSWTNITSTAGTPPSARGYAAATYDATDNYVLLEGGLLTGGTTIVNDTWKFDPVTSTWTKILSTGAANGPLPTFYANMVYVTALTTVYYTCGATGTLVAPTNPVGGCSTWQWTGGSTNTWTNVSGALGGFGTTGIHAPKSSFGGALADFPTYSYAMKFGGETPSGPTQNTSYALGNLLQSAIWTSNAEIVANSGTTMFYANSTFGASPYSVAWTGLPTGCVTGNSSTLSCSPTASGGFNAVGTVHGTDGYNVTNTLFIYVDPAATVTGTIAPGGKLGMNNNATFWGTSENLANNENSTFLGYYNQTSVSFIRAGASCDTSNYSANLQYSNSGVPTALNFNWAGSATATSSTNSVWVACVNGQINNAAAAAYNLNYVENSLHVHPNYWSIGNEPNNWNHWNEPFASWHPGDNKAPTPAQFALEVQNYTIALRAVDPSIKIVGIQAGTTVSTAGPWFFDLGQRDGPNLSAIAIHSYTQNGNGGALQTRANFLSPALMNHYAQNVQYSEANFTAGCPTCNIPMWTGEFNSYGSNSSFNSWQTTFPQAPFTGSGVVQALQTNVTSFDYFRFYGTGDLMLVNASAPTPARPVFTSYTNLYRHFIVGGGTYWANVTAGMNGVYSVETQPNNYRSLLVVNANTSVTLNITSLGTTKLGTGPVAYKLTQAGGATATTYLSPAIPSYWSIPPMGLLLIVGGAAVVTNYSAPPPHQGTLGPAACSTLFCNIIVTFPPFIVVVGVTLAVVGLVAMFVGRASAFRAAGLFLLVVGLILTFVVG